MFLEAPHECGDLVRREGITLLQVVDEGMNVELLVGVSECDKRLYEPPPAGIVDKLSPIFREFLAGAVSVEGSAFLVGRSDIEPVDALGADEKRLGRVQILYLELVADVRMVAELAGLDRRLKVVVITRIAPLTEGDRKIVLLAAQGKDVRRCAAGPAHGDGSPGLPLLSALRQRKQIIVPDAVGVGPEIVAIRTMDDTDVGALAVHPREEGVGLLVD